MNIDQPPVSDGSDLEQGIFNLVVTLCQIYGQETAPELARERVALYLERLVGGLRSGLDEAGQRKESQS